ncbi:hypothetical protein [Marivita sp. XM-24bin2]|jgi:hypothetical protein|uniref:hypothetical protein n=1 Tax=unclassified Marivita TaxID=2632480 RepID=UPI000D79B6E9|nr:hypothetical protein [Marivita sp. XM-24bin2]PWL34646.1 MAG: hypothetical protein DCO97_13260 [Marivita sp. XM-24bin2]
MGVLKTFRYAALLTCLAATAAKPEPDLLLRVASCVGRLSAQIEHHWLMSNQPTKGIETQRAHMLDILDALVTAEVATRALANRIDAKLAHASLLTQAAFSNDTRRATWAEKRAKQELALCSLMLPQPAAESPVAGDTDQVSAIEPVNQETWRASQ